jgi:hypothetical protein
MKKERMRRLSPPPIIKMVMELGISILSELKKAREANWPMIPIDRNSDSIKAIQDGRAGTSHDLIYPLTFF